MKSAESSRRGNLSLQRESKYSETCPAVDGATYMPGFYEDGYGENVNKMLLKNINDWQTNASGRLTLVCESTGLEVCALEMMHYHGG